MGSSPGMLLSFIYLLLSISFLSFFCSVWCAMMSTFSSKLLSTTGLKFGVFLCNPGESGETSFGEDDMQDDAIFLGHSFLQKLQVRLFCLLFLVMDGVDFSLCRLPIMLCFLLPCFYFFLYDKWPTLQIKLHCCFTKLSFYWYLKNLSQAEMLGWLRTMQLDPIGDDNSIRALLKLPPYKAHPVTSKSFVCLYTGFSAIPSFWYSTFWQVSPRSKCHKISLLIHIMSWLLCFI